MSSTIETTKTTDITSNFICHVTNSIHITNSVSVSITSATNTIVTSSIIGSAIRTPIITSTENATDDDTTKKFNHPRNKPDVVPILLFSVVAGLLGLCSITCFIRLILKRKKVPCPGTV